MQIKYTLWILLTIFSYLGCGGGGGGGGGGGNTTSTATQPCSDINNAGPDDDNDGLPDCYEVLIGTSPADVDSDGDGLTDYDEVVTKAFDASINNFQFNPRIADVPQINVELQSIPDISISYTDSQSTSQTMGVTRTTESATTLTNSETYEQSVSEEVSGTVGSSFGADGFGISSSTTYSVSQQESMSWTTTQSSENRRSRAQMEETTSQTGITNSGGNIAVLIKVQNRGYQTITLSNMTITALQVDPKAPEEVQLVTGMDYDTSTGTFPAFDIPPNAESNSLPFTAELALGKTYELLEDSRNLSIEPTTWNITDQDGRSYTHNLTNVMARSAQVIIDFAGAGNRGIENYFVATVTDFGQNRISAATAMDDIVKAPYTEGTGAGAGGGNNSGLLSVRDVNGDAAVNGHWLVIHNYLDTDGVTRLSKVYDTQLGSYSLDDIPLAKGEVLHLMYYQDQDGDGVGSREEFLHGTSDTDADSDDDGLSDFDEIRGGWEVPVTESLTRTVYSDPTRKDVDNDALEDGEERTLGANPNKKDTDNDGILDSFDTAITVADMQERAYLPLDQGQLNDAGINANVATDGSFSFASDRFGTANGAVSFTADADQLDVFNMFADEPLNGASMVMWIKVDPTLPVDGWNLYNQINTFGDTDPFTDVVNQHGVIYPTSLWIFGDGVDRHSFFPSSHQLPAPLAFADWHMLAIVGEEESVGGGMSKFTVYFDGELYGSISNQPDVRFLSTEPWQFASPVAYAVSVGQYRGAMDDIRFFARALDSEEIRLLYNSP